MPARLPLYGLPLSIEARCLGKWRSKTAAASIRGSRTGVDDYPRGAACRAWHMMTATCSPRPQHRRKAPAVGGDPLLEDGPMCVRNARPISSSGQTRLMFPSVSTVRTCSGSPAMALPRCDPWDSRHRDRRQPPGVLTIRANLAPEPLSAEHCAEMDSAAALWGIGRHDSSAAHLKQLRSPRSIRGVPADAKRAGPRRGTVHWRRRLVAMIGAPSWKSPQPSLPVPCTIALNRRKGPSGMTARVRSFARPNRKCAQPDVRRGIDLRLGLDMK